MNLFTRFSATLMAGVDKTVSQIENHDAVVEASLKESQRAAAQARVRLQRVTRDGKALVHRQSCLNEKIQHWSDRAKVMHNADRALALQCIAKRKQCINEEREVQTALKQHAELEGQMVEAITHIERRVATLSQQRNLMRSRQSSAEAHRIINSIEGSLNNGLDDTFERWEITVSETEINAGAVLSCNVTDRLDSHFNEIEEQQALEAELDAFIAEDRATKREGDEP